MYKEPLEVESDSEMVQPTERQRECCRETCTLDYARYIPRGGVLIVCLIIL